MRPLFPKQAQGWKVQYPCAKAGNPESEAVFWVQDLGCTFRLVSLTLANLVGLEMLPQTTRAQAEAVPFRASLGGVAWRGLPGPLPPLPLRPLQPLRRMALSGSCIAAVACFVPLQVARIT